MTEGPLDVPVFPGAVLFIEACSPRATRAIARAMPTPSESFVSRSYRGCCGLVATHSSRVGVDIEVVDLTVCTEAVLTPTEMTLGGTPAMWCDWWSAKEALAKALGNARLYDPRRLESPAHWENGRSGRWACSRLGLPPGFVGWVVWEEVATRDTADAPDDRRHVSPFVGARSH